MNAAALASRLLGILAAVLLAIGGPTAARAAGETPIRIPDQAVYDLAGAFDQGAERTAESLAGAIRANGDADVVVVSETVQDGFTAQDALVRATALRWLSRSAPITLPGLLSSGAIPDLGGMMSALGSIGNSPPSSGGSGGGGGGGFSGGGSGGGGGGSGGGF